MKVVIDDVEFGGLATDVLSVGHAVQVNLVEDGVFRALPAAIQR